MSGPQRTDRGSKWMRYQLSCVKKWRDSLCIDGADWRWGAAQEVCGGGILQGAEGLCKILQLVWEDFDKIWILLPWEGSVGGAGPSLTAHVTLTAAKKRLLPVLSSYAAVGQPWTQQYQLPSPLWSFAWSLEMTSYHINVVIWIWQVSVIHVRSEMKYSYIQVMCICQFYRDLN